MACAHGVDVELLHDLYVLDHALHAHHIASVWVYLVAVGALYEDGLSVDQELRVLDLYRSEAHLLRNDLKHTLLVLQNHICLVKIRCLGGPCFCVRQLYGALCSRGLCHELAVFVAELHSNVGLAAFKRHVVA